MLDDKVGIFKVTKPLEEKNDEWGHLKEDDPNCALAMTYA
jgi:hypothetical protein